ncbi:MAG: PLP-dependent aminotransferase family protein [Anaerolineae bacterium]|nr:PLP-dependent aminotransferase family protein [Anaerolineae bacterium]
MTISFARGVPIHAMMPVDLLAHSSQQALEKDSQAALPYGSVYGYGPLRNWLAQQNGTDVDHIIIGNGSMNLIANWAQHYIHPGDYVLVESPTYDRALTILRSLGAQVVALEQYSDGIDPDELAAYVRQYRIKMAYLIPDFNNPSGVSTSEEKRRAIANLAQQNDFIVVEDGAYSSLRYVGQPIPPIRHYAPDHTVSTGSFSKLLAPGLRTGWMIVPDRRVKDFTTYLQNTYISPNQFAQATIAEAVTSADFGPHLKFLHETYLHLLNLTQDALLERLAPLGATWTKPDGGFFFGINLPPTRRPVWDAADDQGLQLVNGDAFFALPKTNNYIRLPFCSLTEGEVSEGIERLATLVADNLA